MKEYLGGEYEDFENALKSERYRGLRINPLKKNADEDSKIEKYPMVSTLEKIPWAENGYYYTDDQPGKHPFHEAGVYYIQEPSAMLPAQLLEAEPGERILDLCAAPGGKSTQIAGFMEGKGLLVCNEINPQRARILSENIERMGIRNAVVTNETPARLKDRFQGFFDRIMVDAPCSGEGMFRKNEEAVGEWSPENVRMCAERQAQILDCAADMLKNGGRLCYSTCTFAPEENEEQMEAFTERHPEFVLSSSNRLWPHKVKGEGHFASVLEKRAASGESADIAGYGAEEAEPDRGEDRRNKGSLAAATVSPSDKKKLLEYLGDIVKPECFEEEGILASGRLESFGDSIYLLPTVMPALKGLKVLRPGLCLGSLKKDRFEPAHSLALALSPGMARRSIDLSVGDARDYIKGLTKNSEGEKGWTLVLVEGYSLGWGKVAGGVLKNHYPKGLRIS